MKSPLGFESKNLTLVNSLSKFSRGKLVEFDKKLADLKGGVVPPEVKETLIMIPDLGDGLNTVKGMAQSLSFVYRHLRKSVKYMYSVVSMSYPKNILQKPIQCLKHS